MLILLFWNLKVLMGCNIENNKKKNLNISNVYK